MDQRDRMRAADADREVAAERLRLALSEGRLDLHEYDERLQRAYAAKTYGDLDGLLADLPGPVPAARAQVARPEPAAGPVAPVAACPDATRRWLFETWGGYLRVVSITVAVWAAIFVMSGDYQGFWPGWVAGPWGAVLLVSTVGGLLRGEPQRWAVRQARRRRAEVERRPAGAEDA